MFKSQTQKSLSLTLIGALLYALLAAPAFAAPLTPEAKEAARVAKIKSSITELGTGTDATIKIKLRDKTKLAGYVSEAGVDSFTITDAKTGAATEVPYPNVVQAKGKNLSTGAAIAIGIGIGVGATFLTLYLLFLALED
ncbi:MAG: hypothetical protein HOP19_21445 [Acidobacteria bacterium]|nr:hypothetical protein [Acidobacteriota bacterium]